MRIQQKLKNNKSRKKPHSKERYPYLLSGLTFCMTCKDVMCGKSAHGNGGKIGYYEHGWATKRDSALSKKIFKCDPHRVLAKKLEPVVIEKIQSLLNSDDFAKKLFERVKQKSENDSQKKEYDQLKAKLYGINSQIEAMAERLSELPKSVSPAPIYKQMEILEERKVQLQIALESQKRVEDTPISFKEFKSFQMGLRQLWKEASDPKTKSQIIQKLVHRIEVGTASVKIYFHAGLSHFLINIGSNSLTFGARRGT